MAKNKMTVDDENLLTKISSATALVMLSIADKRRFTHAAKEHDMSFSALVRASVEEFLANHGWE